MRSSARLLALLLVAACAGTPDDDPLVWSDELVRALPREEGDVIEAANFSRAPLGAVRAPWESWMIVRGNTPTAYRVVPLDGATAVEADSTEGGSGLWRKIRVDLKRQPVLEWRWRVPLEMDTPFEVNSRQSPPVRLSLAFHGDTSKLDFEDRAKLRLAKVLTVHGLPYASLVYVWLRDVPAETVVPSPHTERVRLVVVQSGAQRLGEWVTIRRNVLEDYRRAFGEDPEDVVGIGLMTDYGDDGSRRRAFYGDITFRSGP
jgi:Protein of unknown function (DUF3047)